CEAEGRGNLYVFIPLRLPRRCAPRNDGSGEDENLIL
ncbi:MAG: hypothetical protein K0R76_1662, partial [Alphaproteobacteria bacterium]|nr:hypothetical protein [Alphaproteobacteria bacterium]